MTNTNPLASLYLEAARTIAQHDSSIATVASSALNKAAQSKLVKPPHTVVQCKALSTAYEQTTNSLNTIVEQLEHQLHWTDKGSGVKPKNVQAKLAYVELIGPTGMVVNENCRIGLFLQSEQTDYPNHRHAAEELYLVISGRAWWTKESEPPPVVKQPGEFMHHTSWEPHAMQTTTEPLLAMWCWVGAIGFDQYELV